MVVKGQHDEESPKHSGLATRLPPQSPHRETSSLVPCHDHATTQEGSGHGLDKWQMKDRYGWLRESLLCWWEQGNQMSFPLPSSHLFSM